MSTMTETTHDARGDTHDALEDTLTAAIGAMRELAANAGTDDYEENWSREVLDRCPLIVVTAVTNNGTWMWVREPAHDAVLHAEVGSRGFPYPDGGPLAERSQAQLGVVNRSLAAISEEVSWLVKDRYTGLHLGERLLGV
jgi:hypothetical protein